MARGLFLTDDGVPAPPESRDPEAAVPARRMQLLHCPMGLVCNPGRRLEQKRSAADDLLSLLRDKP
jgi:hypothetical protein